MGGAYGGFARFSATTGRLVYMSYRDPNLQKTLDIYNNAPGFLESHSLSKEELSSGIIGAIGDLDGPMMPDQKGYNSMVEYLMGESQADRQHWRDSVLGATPSDFAHFGKRLERIS